mgnify:CR=1 FL=1
MMKMFRRRVFRVAASLGLAFCLFITMTVHDLRAVLVHGGSVLAGVIAEPSPEDPRSALLDGGPRVDQAISFYTNVGRAWMQKGLLRSTSYLPVIREIFERHGVPAELACIAFVESGFDNKATSPVWAHGMWQFMPETARAFGLRVDWSVDERQDYWRASEAAAKYLAGLYKQFGDWLLAAAAYNAGQNYIKSRLEATGATSFWELVEKDALWKETTHYVPRILAAMRIFRDPQRYGFSMDGALEPLTVCRGRIAVSTLVEASAICGVPVNRLIELNPHLERGMIPDEKNGYELTLPDPGEYSEQDDATGMS